MHTFAFSSEVIIVVHVQKRKIMIKEKPKLSSNTSTTLVNNEHQQPIKHKLLPLPEK